MSATTWRAVTVGRALSDPVCGRPDIPAETPVVMPLWAAQRLVKAWRADGVPIRRVSTVGYYTRPYCGQDLDGRTLLAHRGAGIGDQLIAAGCLQVLARRYPDARLRLACDPYVVKGLWTGAEGMPFDVVPEPIPLAEWSAYDYHWLVEGYCDGDTEPDQPDVWDGHLDAIGIGHLVEESERRVYVPRSEAWTSRAARFLGLASNGTCAQRPLVLWQLAASTPMRSLTPGQSAAALRLLVQRCPEALILLTGTDDQYEAYAEACAVDGIAATTRGLKLQEVFALAGMAAVVVAPDSCLGHVAAAFDVPCVCYWCPFPARSRATHYRRHVNLSPDLPPDCAPCWAHELAVQGPQRGCPLTVSDPAAEKWCKGLAAIRPEAVVEAVAKEIE